MTCPDLRAIVTRYIAARDANSAHWLSLVPVEGCTCGSPAGICNISGKFGAELDAAYKALRESVGAGKEVGV